MPRLLACSRCGAALQPGFSDRLVCPLFGACGAVFPYETTRRRARAQVPFARRAMRVAAAA